MKTLSILLLVLVVGSVCQGAIKGCTSDVRTGVCNKVCSVSHVQGCTAEQLKPLLNIQAMDCLVRAANKCFDAINRGHSEYCGSPEDKRENDVCQTQNDQAIADWTAAQNGATRKGKK